MATAENPELELWNAIDALGPRDPRPRPGVILEARAGSDRVNLAIRALIAAVQRGEWPPTERTVADDVARMRAIYDRNATL